MPVLAVLWSMLWFFLFIAWIWVVIVVIADVFRSQDLSGWGKAGWTIFIILIPWLGVLVYLIARGHGMQERSAQQAADQQAADDEREDTGSNGHELFSVVFGPVGRMANRP